MASKVLRRLALAAVLVGGTALVAASTAEATRPVRRTTRPQARGFNLFAGAVNVVMNVNRVQCNINTIGETCVDPTNSPVLGGGFWPKGSPDQYIFNGGLQIAALMGGTGHPWEGDTVGAFFFDARGDQAHGEGRTNVYNALNADDLAAWPTAAYINDPTLFRQQLLGRKTVSQQDTWVRYWEGNTNLVTGRQHPMGLLVEQRGLAWNFPSGNEDIIYFLYRFINITSRNLADYAGLSAAGYSADDIAEIAAIGAEFQDRAEAVYNISLPDGGIPFEQMFAAFGQDPDVGQAGANFSNGNFPFSIGFAYKTNFSEPNWQFPPDIFGAPFAAAPGFEGVKYLGSPTNPATGQPFGMSFWSNTTNGGAFPDRVGVQALWRFYSTNLIASDGTCNAPGGAALRHFCQSVQTSSDTRFYEASGPFTLAPGGSAIIVVAYIHAAPVASMTCSGTGACPGGAWSLTPFIGGSMLPGFPVDGTRLVAGTDTLRNVDRAAGWIGHTDLNADGTIQQTEVNVVPRSLYGKSLVAQAVFNNQFLLPFAPEAPTFFLLAGDNKVTVVWEQSSTEADGDPFFAIASATTYVDPADGLTKANPLYDPNFREFDVEGYRVWRGRSEAEMQVVAQFDYSGTSILDYTGAFVTSSSGNRCAPEIGILTSCDAAFDWPNVDPITGIHTPPNVSSAVTVAGDVIQVPPGGRVQLADGTIFIVRADTAVSGGATGFPGLTDTGVPFVFEDNTVRNGFRYFYAVTAFDVNSVASGPTSLESPLVTKQVTPRAPSSNPVTAESFSVQMVGDDGTTALDPTAAFPAINSNGTFGSIIPPTNFGELTFLAYAAEALPTGDFFARIDSVGPGFNGQFSTPDPTIWMSFIAAPDTFRSTGSATPCVFNESVDCTVSYQVSSPLVPFDTGPAGQALGISSTFRGRMPVQYTGELVSLAATGAAISFANGRYGAAGTNAAARWFSHGYWFNAGSTPPANPTINPYPHPSNNSGQLTGVDTIYKPAAYAQTLTGGAAAGAVNAFLRGYGATAAAVWYPGDFLITWNADSTITVRDSTHRQWQYFHTRIMTGYGFLNLDSLVAAGVTAGDVADGTGSPSMAALSYHHLFATYPVCEGYWGITCANLAPKARLFPIDFDGNGTGDGSGIVLILNGEPFYMRMNALPAAGTQWRFTAWGGGSLDATCTPTLPTSGNLTKALVPTSCTFASYTAPANRPSHAGTWRLRVNNARQFDVADAGSLDGIHTVPDPYYVTNSLEITANTKVLRFVNLPHQAIIRIYSTSGILVNILSHNDAAGSGEAVWNLRNRNNQFVASGVYFYHVETSDGREKIGRFTVVNYAQ